MYNQNLNLSPTIFDLLSRSLDSFGTPLKTYQNESFCCDIEDMGDHYQLKADLPGVKKEDINLSFKDGVLTIKAVHHQKKNKVKEQEIFLLNERNEGVYERSFEFEEADEKNIYAAFVKGELDVNIGKIKQEKEKLIKIN